MFAYCGKHLSFPIDCIHTYTHIHTPQLLQVQFLGAQGLTIVLISLQAMGYLLMASSFQFLNHTARSLTYCPETISVV